MYHHGYQDVFFTCTNVQPLYYHCELKADRCTWEMGDLWTPLQNPQAKSLHTEGGCDIC